MPTPVVRPLEDRDVPAVVEIHLAAFPNFFLTFLGREFLRTYYRCIVEFRQIGFVADQGGEMSGFVTGIENGAGFYRRALMAHGARFCLAALRAVLEQPVVVIPRLARAVLKRPSGGPEHSSARATSLTSIAVKPTSSGGGIGHALVAAFRDESARRGFRTIFLETDADDNAAALRFYEREGFLLWRTYTTKEGRRLHEFRMDL